MIRHIQHVSKHICLWSLIMLAIGLSSVRIFLTKVDAYKTDLEVKILELTSIPIEIGKLKANMRGLSPEIILKDLQVLTKDSTGQTAIQLEEVRLGIDLIELFFTHKVLASSWLTLVGAKLSIIRQEDGSITVAGLNAGDSEQPVWLLEGGRYEVLQSEISWLDRQHKFPAVKFEKVDLLIKNEFEQQKHEIHLLSQLPKQYGHSIRVSMSVQGNILEANNIAGMVYIEGSELDLAKLLSEQKYSGIKLTTGKGNIKLWTQWQNSNITSLAGHIMAKKLFLQKKNQYQYQVNSLNTKFDASLNEPEWRFGVKEFILESENRKWPVAEFNIFFNDENHLFSAAGRQVEIQQLTELFQFFAPANTKYKSVVSKLDLKGVLKDFSFFVNTQNHQYAVHGNIDNFYNNAHTDFPRLENISASFKGNHEHGTIAFNTINGQLFFPGLFRKPILMDTFSGVLSWQQSADNWQLQSERLYLDSKDIQTESRIDITIPKNEGSIFMDLQASFFNIRDIAQFTHYYPAPVMDKDLVSWLDTGFVSGKIDQGAMLIYGNLDQFPYLEGQGVFETAYRMDEVELNFNSEWPNIKNLSADVLFTRNDLNIEVSGAEVNHLNIGKTKIEIPDYDTSDFVYVKGQVEGQIVDGLNFLTQTPLKVTALSILESISPGGDTKVDLDLKIPLVEELFTEVNGVAHFNQAVLTVKPVDLMISDVTGELGFTENGFSSDQIQAQSLGYPIDINVINENLVTAIRVKGKTDILQLNKQFNFFDSQSISEQWLTGATDYQLILNLPDNQQQPADLNITSDLLGISVNLPGVLKKSADQSSTFNLAFNFTDRPLFPVTFQYKDHLNAAINIDNNGNSLHSAHVVFGKNQAIIPDYKGVNIDIEQDSFDLSTWVDILDQEDDKLKKSENKFKELSLNTRQLFWNNKNYGQLTLVAQRLETKWQGNVSSSAAKGQFSIPHDRTGNSKIDLNMDYINFSELLKMDIETNNVDSDESPLIKITSEHFLWKEKDIGRLEIDTERISDGFRFQPINIVSDNHKIAMKADWIKKAKTNVTEMNGTITADDAGELLSIFGFDNDLKETSGKVKYTGTWPGLPYQFSLAKMNAELDLNLKNGRISSIEPGFGRILGILAMEQWIKRLALNFGDIFKQGLSFNHISGRFKVSEGIAVSKDLQIDAVPAQINISGEANLLNKTLNHDVIVIPKSSGAVPIAGTIVGTIAGTITQVLTSNYKEGYFFGSKYKLTGNWDDVEVTSLHDQDGIFKKTWSGLTDFSWLKSAAE